MDTIELTKNEKKALDALINEHWGKKEFTSYYKDENDNNVCICTSFMMQRLESKGVLKKVEKKYTNSEPFKYEWI